MEQELHLYFSDLNEEAQKRVLEFYEVESAAEMNADLDIVPITTFVKEV